MGRALFNPVSVFAAGPTSAPGIGSNTAPSLTPSPNCLPDLVLCLELTPVLACALFLTLLSASPPAPTLDPSSARSNRGCILVDPLSLLFLCPLCGPFFSYSLHLNPQLGHSILLLSVPRYVEDSLNLEVSRG